MVLLLFVVCCFVLVCFLCLNNYLKVKKSGKNTFFFGMEKKNLNLTNVFNYLCLLKREWKTGSHHENNYQSERKNKT